MPSILYRLASAASQTLEEVCSTFCLVVSHSRLTEELEASNLLAAMQRASELLRSILYRLPSHTRVTVVNVGNRSFLPYVSRSRLPELCP